jgi:DNA-binding response OmpR family regulator
MPAAGVHRVPADGRGVDPRPAPVERARPADGRGQPARRQSADGRPGEDDDIPSERVAGVYLDWVARLALIEDDPNIRNSLERALRERGHDVRSAATGLAGLSQIVDDRPDVVILDLGLPDIEGLELLKMLRAVSAVPVIAATARDDEREIVRTLDAGADDYVIKPYSADQLEARLRAVLRRVGSPASDTLVVGDLHIDTASRVASLSGEPLDLSRKEFDLLAHLARNPGRVATKRELLAEIWDQPYGGSDKTVDVHLSWLRRKLGETATEPRYLRAVRGVGVKLVDPDT